MKTPLTLTVKLWNYCQNGDGCPYCVASCCKDRWKYRGNFESLPRDEVLDVERLIPWIKKFMPECNVHLSGGEPLLRPDVEDITEAMVNNGIPVTMTTNGLLISKRKRLLTLPIKWIVTHHECNDLENWLSNARLIADKPHIACRLLYGEATPENAPRLAEHYSGLHFMWAKLHGLRITDWTPNPDDLNAIASDVINLVEPDGNVYPCNNPKKAPIGNIYSGLYDREGARYHNTICRGCVEGNTCGAYQSAILANALREPSGNVAPQ